MALNVLASFNECIYGFRDNPVSTTQLINLIEPSIDKFIYSQWKPIGKVILRSLFVRIRPHEVIKFVFGYTIELVFGKIYNIRVMFSNSLII